MPAKAKRTRRPTTKGDVTYRRDTLTARVSRHPEKEESGQPYHDKVDSKDERARGNPMK